LRLIEAAAMAETRPIPDIAVTDERPAPDVAVIAVAGQIDLYSAPEFKAATLRAIEEGATRLVIDLTNTSFIDSTGLGVLIGAMKRLAPCGGSVEIVCPDTSVQRLFEISGLARRFEIHESLDALWIPNHGDHARRDQDVDRAIAED
jgi:anti-sigma B factor antagonist